MNAIAVDAMGGDDAPAPEVAGAVAAVGEAEIEVILVGDQGVLSRQLAEHSHPERIRILHASEVVGMADHPSKVFRTKRDSSLRRAVDLVQSGAAQGLVSAGNSGAILSHCVLVLGRVPLVERPGIVTVFPTPVGEVVMCDMGANVDVKPTMLAQFGILAAFYDRILHDRARPRVGLVSNGVEAGKGTELTRAADGLLRRAASNASATFEYVGYVEGSALFDGSVDVAATDGFTGNVLLKGSEAVTEAVFEMVNRALAKVLTGAADAKLALAAVGELERSVHYAEAGGGVLLGVQGVATICHGKSDARAIKNAILSTHRFVEASLTEQLVVAMERHSGLWSEMGRQEMGH